MDSRSFLWMDPAPLQPVVQERHTPRARPALVFSPPKQVKPRKEGQENEQPPVMLLMQFQPKEYLNFQQIQVGSSKTLQVRLKNPSSNIQDVEFRKFPSIDKGFRVENRHLSVRPHEEVTLDVIWEPTQPLKISESIYMSTSDGHHLQIVLIGTAVKAMPKQAKRGPNRKATLAKGRTFQVLPRTSSMQLQQKKRNDAAVLIQKTWRGYWTRKLVWERVNKINQDRINYHRMDLAAIKIQRFWRDHMARKLFLEMVKQEEDRKMQHRMNCAALTIQRFWRGHLARQLFREMIKQEEDRKMQYRMNCAAVTIQRFWRGHTARQLFLKMVKQEEERKLRNRMDCAALTVQKFWRGHLARKLFREKIKQVEEINKHHQMYCAAVTIQRFWRGHMVRINYHRMNCAAVLIQRFWRGHVARKLFQTIKQEQERKQHRMDWAAVTIQRFWRGYWTRKNIYAKLKELEIVRRRVSLLQCNEEQRLGNRTSVALQAILTYKTLDKISQHLNSLIATTRMSPESCMTIAQAGAARVLLALIDKVNRSIHSQELICMILDILINLAKFLNTWYEVASAKNIITTVLNHMKRNCTNEKILCKGFTLLYILFTRAPDDKSKPELDATAKKLLRDIFDSLEREISRKATTKPVKKPTKKTPAFNPYWAAKADSASEFKNKFDAYFYVNSLKIPF